MGQITHSIESSCSQLFLKGNLRQCDDVQTYSIDIPMAGRRWPTSQKSTCI